MFHILIQNTHILGTTIKQILRIKGGEGSEDYSKYLEKISFATLAFIKFLGRFIPLI